jgi:hypothetical protein
MNDASNPYAPPGAEGAARAPAVVDFGEIVRRWELLRIRYNAVLIALVLLLVVIFFPERFSIARFWVQVFGGAVIANLCFTAGPTVEGYGRFLFRTWLDSMTVLLFLAGTCFAALLAVFCVLTWN